MHTKNLINTARFALISALVFALCTTVALAGPRQKKTGSSLKYVFYFIGDGMANVQVHAAEAYLAALAEDDAVPGGIKADLLAMSQFPVQGMSTTFANNRLITGSAAAGTALATGKKTNIGVISMDPSTSISYNSLAEKAKEKGMKVGIVTSVTINHATPAVFYSHTYSRNNYYDIATDLVNSDFDYFGGGFWNRDNDSDLEPTATANGFTITLDLPTLQAQTPGTRVIAFDSAQDAGDHKGALLYDMDRSFVNGMSLANFTEEGIRLLDNPDGFFMMVEGGKIDWACHANDARAAIEDTIAFDNAIQKAVDFYNAHPNETLIVITADHECGGQTIGFAGTGYDTFFEILEKQTMSFEFFNATELSDYKASHASVTDIDADMWQIIFTNFGLDGAGLSPETADDLSNFQKEQLEDAFDRTMTGTPITGSEEDYLLYGGYQALTVTLTHILNQRAGIGWTSYSHTGVPVPVLAMGKYAEIFDGFYDNTDVALRIAQAMGVNLGN
ncbi:MAG: alkaline phosphatase [Desulfobacteraceae bacterium]|jgi:alkaline phosphatase